MASPAYKHYGITQNRDTAILIHQALDEGFQFVRIAVNTWRNMNNWVFHSTNNPIKMYAFYASLWYCYSLCIGGIIFFNYPLFLWWGFIHYCSHLILELHGNSLWSYFIDHLVLFVQNFSSEQVVNSHFYSLIWWSYHVHFPVARDHDIGFSHFLAAEFTICGAVLVDQHHPVTCKDSRV